MNCLDCTDSVAAVAVCGRCGAGVCRTHLLVGSEHLTVIKPLNRPVPVDPPARRLRCAQCAAAEQAQAREPGRAA